MGNPFSESEILHFLANIFLAVFHLNSRDIFHRDIKPANLLIKREANEKTYLYLTDFGIAKDISGKSERSSSDLDDIKGTIEAHPPEILNPRNSKKPKIIKQDVWAIGTIAY
jgi:serine/threonine protein kinase